MGWHTDLCCPRPATFRSRCSEQVFRSTPTKLKCSMMYTHNVVHTYVQRWENYFHKVTCRWFSWTGQIGHRKLSLEDQWRKKIVECHPLTIILWTLEVTKRLLLQQYLQNAILGFERCWQGRKSALKVVRWHEHSEIHILTWSWTSTGTAKQGHGHEHGQWHCHKGNKQPELTIKQKKR